MSYKITTPIWENAPYGGTKLLVLLAMADTAGHDGSFFISQTDLARQARCSIEYVRACVTQFVADGILVIVRKGTARGRATDYRIVLPLPNSVGGSVPVDSPTPEANPPTPTVEPPNSARGQQSFSTERSTEPPPPPSGGGAVAVLPGMPEEPERRYTAADLVAAWVDGYRAHRHTDPLRSQVKRMASSAKRLAADLDGLDDPRAWDAGLHLARRAGQDAHLDLVTAVGRYHERSGTTAWWVTLRAGQELES